MGKAVTQMLTGNFVFLMQIENSEIVKNICRRQIVRILVSKSESFLFCTKNCYDLIYDLINV